MADAMTRIVTLAELLVRQKEKVDEKTEELKEAQKAMLRTEREDLPELFTELGLTEIKLKDGSKVAVVEDAAASITEANRSEAHAWLIAHEFGGLIKTEVALSFPRGEHEEAIKTRDSLMKQGYEGVALNEAVHHSTLRAFVKEQLQDGKAIPFDLFSIQPYSKAVIKRS